MQLLTFRMGSRFVKQMKRLIWSMNHPMLTKRCVMPVLVSAGLRSPKLEALRTPRATRRQLLWAAVL